MKKHGFKILILIWLLGPVFLFLVSSWRIDNLQTQVLELELRTLENTNKDLVLIKSSKIAINKNLGHILTNTKLINKLLKTIEKIVKVQEDFLQIIKLQED